MRSLFTFKHLLASLSLLLLFAGGAFIPVQAQGSFGHEWINFDQPYYKIPITRTGLYRLDYNYLSAAGLANANPRLIQVFRRGRQVAAFLAGQDDGRLDAGDYLEFYGEKNDGKTDVELYQKREFKVHDYYSLYTDTAAYFLTVHPTQAGKRMAMQLAAPTGLSAGSWHMHTRRMLYTQHYSRGAAIALSQQPFGDNAEGFFSDYFGAQAGGSNRQNPATFTVDSLIYHETGGPPPTIEIGLVSSHYTSPDVTITVVSAGGDRVLASNIRFAPFGHVKLTYPLQAGDISPAGTVTIRVKINSVVPAGGLSDLERMAYIKVHYPRRNTLVNNRDLYVSLPDSSKTTPTYLVFDGAGMGALAYDVTDPLNITRHESIAAGSQRGFVFPGSGRQRKLLITSNNKYYVPAPATKRHFKQFDPQKAAYVIISNKQLAKAVPDYVNPVQAYAEYRASAAGGGHDTLLFYVDQLYDQFHYGDRSALAVRRLMLYLLANGNPRFLFLVGKGVEPDYGDGNFRRNPAAYPVFDLVPTGGAPASDAVFTSDFQRNDFEPRVATGRIAAMHAGEVASYLDKVKLHESLPQNTDWRKRLLHLGGGSDLTQQQQFRTYLKSYEIIAQSPPLGGKVETISRLTALEPVEVINLSEQINQGVSLITFFGHSSPSGADIDFGYASNPVNNYNNLGKYPMILLNGCFSGNAFSPVVASQRSFGEDWVLTPRKGAIAFLAHSAFGYTSPLYTYSRNFYQVAFANPDFYGKPLGTVIKEVIKRASQSGNELLVATALEMVLQADPALLLIGPDKPDYALRDNITLQSFQQFEPVTAASDSFRVVIPLRNLGRATTDSFHVSVSRNGVLLKSTVKYPPVYYQDTLYFAFNLTAGRVAGENTFVVSIDPDNALAELDEGNNTIQFTYNFPASGARALFPVEYSLVNTRQVKLVGQATNLLQGNRIYAFELDTTHTFTSPAKQSREMEAGPFPEWTVSLLPDGSPQDSVVYYWRFRLKDRSSATDTIWGASSFRYIPASSPGWSQSKYGQFTKAQGEQISLNKTTQQWAFASSFKNLQLRAAGGQLSASYPPYGILVNGALSFDGGCPLGQPNLVAIVFSDKTLAAHQMPAGFAATSCGLGKTFYHFSDLRQPANREYMRRFLEAVPAGFHVAMVSVNSVPFSDFSQEQKNAFRSLGSRMIDSVQTGFPFALVGQKGAAIGSATELGYNPNDPLPPVLQSVEVDTNIAARGSDGTITSTMIGPAAAWGSLYHRVQKDKSGTDSYRLQVIGYDLEKKNPTILHDNVLNRNQDLSAIDAARYPHLQLALQVADSVNRTAPQLQEWRVTYQGVPEGVVRADLVGVEQYANLGAQAAKGKITGRFAFQNISELNFTDSLLARITVVGSDISKELKLAPLKKEEVAYIPYSFATHDLKGNYTLRLSVNPLLNNPSVQPEQYYTNNTLDVPFTYDMNLPPILDVAFNGRHIMDGDIVSPSPEISITLKDEDQYTLIQDPSHMELFLQLPGGSAFTPVDLNGDQVAFTPATKDKDFRLVFSPQDLPDGIYTLRVQGKDAANNLSGFEPYTIRFEVINESSVTHFYPYPNPFSTKTRFVFTLTGSTVPDNMKIQIMTITGKVVREIMQEELGPIRIGPNISDFAWDGSDEFGDKLANGVYLYRVVMTGTDDFKHRYSNGDKSFKKDYGKIYILR